jgi:hypothetical protein
VIGDTGAQVRTVTVDGVTSAAISRDGGSTWIALPEPKGLLTWRDRSFDPLQGDGAVPAALMSDDSNQLFYVQFVTDIVSEYAEALEALGAETMRYYPHDAYLVRLSREAVEAVRGQPFVRAVMEQQLAHKLDTPLQAAILEGDLATARYNIMLMDKQADGEAFVARLGEIGGVLEAPFAGGVVLSATLTPEQLMAVARENTVVWIDRWTAPEEDMDIARMQTGADYVEGLAFTAGHGIRGHVNEAVYEKHPEFRAILPYRTEPLVWGSNSGSFFNDAATTEIYTRAPRRPARSTRAACPAA